MPLDLDPSAAPHGAPACAAVWVSLAVVFGAPPSAHAVDYWALPAASRVEVVKTADQERRGGGFVTEQGMPVLNRMLARWDELPEKEAASYAIQTSAMLEALGFKGVARVYSAYALSRVPDDDVALSNYAAISCYPPHLRAAVAAVPKSPVVHTNLGSCAMSARQWELARASYTKALELKPEHTNALLGMGQWWLRQGDIERAAEYYLRAKRFRVLRKKQAKGEKEPPPPDLRLPPRSRFPAPGGGGEAGGDEGGGTAHVTDTTLRLPDLPRWPGPDAFLASARARKPLVEFYGKRMAAGLKFGMEKIASNPLKEISERMAALEAMTPAEKEQAQLEASLTRPWDDSEVLEGMEENSRWLKKRLEDADARFKEATAVRKAIGKQLSTLQKQLGDRFKSECGAGGRRPQDAAAAVEAANRCLEAFRKTAIDTCLQSKELRARSFTVWRDAYAAWYGEVREPLERYYQVQGSWIRQIADERAWRLALLMRDTVTFTPLFAKGTLEDVERMGVAVTAAASFGITAEVCPREPPAPVDPEPPPEIPKVDEPKPWCPLKKGKSIKIPPGDIPFLPLSFEITCEAATMTLSAGLMGDDHIGPAGAAAVLSVTHNFGTDKSTTLFLGVQGSLTMDVAGGVPIVGAGSLGVSTQLGVAVTFDRNGQPTGAEGRFNFDDTAKAAGGWLGELSEGMAATAVLEKGPPEADFRGGGGT